MTRRVVLTTALATTPFLSAEDDNKTTAGLENGRAWNLMDFTTRLYYVIAIANASLVYDSVVAKNPRCHTVFLSFPQNLTYGEISSELGKFFETPVNRQIPIIWAINYVGRKAVGDSEERLKELESSYRGMAANAK